jgi:hypothetical protein
MESSAWTLSFSVGQLTDSLDSRIKYLNHGGFRPKKAKPG